MFGLESGENGIIVNGFPIIQSDTNIGDFHS